MNDLIFVSSADTAFADSAVIIVNNNKLHFQYNILNIFKSVPSILV